MSDFKFTCPHCQQHLSADSSMGGTEVACPNCSKQLVLPDPPASRPLASSQAHQASSMCPYCRSEISSTDRTRVCPSCHTSHHADCWKENMGCTVFGCSLAPPDEDKTSAAGAIPGADSGNICQQAPPLVASQPLFLHIPLSRLVIMSVVSLGIYHAYWIFKNSLYLKERDGVMNELDWKVTIGFSCRWLSFDLDSRTLSPFWRATFGLFYCGGLLKAIQADRQANNIEKATFSAGGLAAGWGMLTVLGVAMSFSHTHPLSFIGALVWLASFGFLLPVQDYINRVNARASPPPLYAAWSSGHIACLFSGVVLWVVLFVRITP